MSNQKEVPSFVSDVLEIRLEDNIIDINMWEQRNDCQGLSDEFLIKEKSEISFFFSVEQPETSIADLLRMKNHTRTVRRPMA